MTQSEHPATRSFQCEHCGGEIRIPYELPPTEAPCPHCEELIESPAAPDHGAEEGTGPAEPPIGEKISSMPEEAAPEPAVQGGQGDDSPSALGGGKSPKEANADPLPDGKGPERAPVKLPEDEGREEPKSTDGLDEDKSGPAPDTPPPLVNDAVKPEP